MVLVPPHSPAWHDVDLPCATAVRGACGVVRTRLAELDLRPQTLDDALIVVGELVLNAVEHGGPRPDGSVSLGWRITSGHLMLRVVDGGGPSPVGVGHVSADGLRGRGLAMVATLCDSWSVQSDGGTTVVATIAL